LSERPWLPQNHHWCETSDGDVVTTASLWGTWGEGQARQLFGQKLKIRSLHVRCWMAEAFCLGSAAFHRPSTCCMMILANGEHIRRPLVPTITPCHAHSSAPTLKFPRDSWRNCLHNIPLFSSATKSTVLVPRPNAALTAFVCSL
jgi:hypothetical protein